MAALVVILSVLVLTPLRVQRKGPRPRGHCRVCNADVATSLRGTAYPHTNPQSGRRCAGTFAPVIEAVRKL